MLQNYLCKIIKHEQNCQVKDESQEKKDIIESSL